MYSMQFFLYNITLKSRHLCVCVCVCVCVFSEDAVKARATVKKISGRPVQVLFANNRPLRQSKKKSQELDNSLTKDVSKHEIE